MQESYGTLCCLLFVCYGIMLSTAVPYSTAVQQQYWWCFSTLLHSRWAFIYIFIYDLQLVFSFHILYNVLLRKAYVRLYSYVFPARIYGTFLEPSWKLIWKESQTFESLWQVPSQKRRSFDVDELRTWARSLGMRCANNKPPIRKVRLTFPLTATTAVCTTAEEQQH